jgi:hypothetical protein
MDSFLSKLETNLHWMARYPLTRSKSFLSRNLWEKKRLIFCVANHFEPSWKDGGWHDLDTQRRRLDEWHKMARAIGEAVTDSDGTKFRHTNFFPIEQYDERLLDVMAEMQREGLGEVEIHLHHGVEAPDTAENLRKTLIEGRDLLAARHKLLSRWEDGGEPMYAFVHGNLALANSWDGMYCGVDEEMQILRETGCYVDLTLPVAPKKPQVPILNQIYEYELNPAQRAPHRKGKRIETGRKIRRFPVIFQGPLVLNWSRRINGFPVPRIDDGALAYNQEMNLARLNRWISANVTVAGKPDWIFVKLYCHGFFEQDQAACIGADARRFFAEAVENGARTGDYTVHFASAREAFNMILAAVDERKGTPNDFRNYKLRAIMDEAKEGFQKDAKAHVQVK